jgi:hypothetical protein
LRPFRPCGNDRAPLRLRMVRIRGSPARCRSSVVEHFIGNEEVLSSILSGSTSSRLIDQAFVGRHRQRPDQAGALPAEQARLLAESVLGEAQRHQPALGQDRRVVSDKQDDLSACRLILALLLAAASWLAIRRTLGYGRVPLLPDAALLGPMAAGLALGSGTAMAMAAGVGLAVAALGSATIVSPTLNCPLVCPARTKDQGSRHRTKANLHIFLLPARHQPSDFATGVCRDGTAVPTVRSAVAIQPSAARMRPGGLCDACGSRKC